MLYSFLNFQTSVIRVNMTEAKTEKIIESAFQLLAEFLPGKTDLYFPILSAVINWILAREKEWKEKILSWQIWPDPDYVKNKSDDFLLEFFQSHPGLSSFYQQEIKNKDLSVLRSAFSRLYPVVGLEDPFLLALFSKEIASQNYRKIVGEFDSRVKQAKKEIRAIKKWPELLAGLESLVKEILSLSSELLTQSKSRKAIEDLIKLHLQNQEKND